MFLSVIKASFFGSIWSVFKICEVIASLVNKDLLGMELTVSQKIAKGCKIICTCILDKDIFCTIFQPFTSLLLSCEAEWSIFPLK